MSDARIPNYADRIVGERLAAARRENGLSQADLAVRLGISSLEVSEYESGEKRISADLLLEVVCILSKPVDFFFHKPLDEHAGDATESDQQVRHRLLNMIIVELDSIHSTELLRELLEHVRGIASAGSVR